MTPIINVLSGPCGCGGSCCGGGGGHDHTMGDVSSPSSQPSGGGNIISSALSAIGHLFGGGSKTPACAPPAGCFSCKIEGQGGIAGCIDNVTQQWIAAAHQRDAGQISNAQLLAMTQQILAGLSNASYFTPQSDSYLAQAKQIFQQRLNDIQTAMATGIVTGSTQLGTAQNATSATTAGATSLGLPATILGISTPTLLIASGVGFLAFSLMKKDS